MYSIVLAVHSWLRWAVLLLAILALVRALTGASRRTPWTPADDRTGALFVGALDLQIVIGLILYFVLSPLTRMALDDFGRAMQISSLRYYAVEHVFGMLIAAAFAHVGRARLKKITDTARRHKVAAIFFGLALAAILASIPWPGMPAGRPLLRW